MRHANEHDELNKVKGEKGQIKLTVKLDKKRKFYGMFNDLTGARPYNDEINRITSIQC